MKFQSSKRGPRRNRCIWQPTVNLLNVLACSHGSIDKYIPIETKMENESVLCFIKPLFIVDDPASELYCRSCESGRSANIKNSLAMCWRYCFEKKTTSPSRHGTYYNDEGQQVLYRNVCKEKKNATYAKAGDAAQKHWTVNCYSLPLLWLLFWKNVHENVEHGKHMHSETCFALVMILPEWKRLLSDHVNGCG